MPVQNEKLGSYESGTTKKKQRKIHCLERDRSCVFRSSFSSFFAFLR